MIGFFTVENYYEPQIFLKATTISRKKNIFLENFNYKEKDQANHGNYCELSSCKTITCSLIPAAHDPGNITSNFIKSIFKVQCPFADAINLKYKNCKFPSNTIKKDWLNVDVDIEQLTFEGCSLNRIDDEAFFSKIFTQVKRLCLFSNNISSLNRLIFSKFIELDQIFIQNNIIDYAESNLLANIANTLKVLQLDGAIKDSHVLRNITGEKMLWNLESLFIQDNFITVLTPDLFTGIPKIRSLYLENSRIMEIRSNTFEPMAGSLEQLFLRSNQISTLPKGIFNFVLSSKKIFQVYLTENNWHCDCELKWMKEFIEKHPSVVNQIPLCMTPEYNAQLSFIQARFCNESITDTTTTPMIESTTKNKNDSSINETTVGIPCNEIISKNYLSLKVSGRKLMSIDYEFPTRIPNFTLKELNDGTIIVSLPDEKDSVLLWFDDQIQEDIQRSIHCVKDVKGSFLLKNTSPCTTYTICFLENQEARFSPLNCLGITTKPGLEDRAWLTNGYKPMVYLVLTTLMFLFCGISAFGMFIVLRRNPSLLRGSKRVLIIKHRKIEAMILPKGVELDRNEIIKETEVQPINKGSTDTKPTTEDGYVTPLPPNRRFVRKDSRISRISLQTYATGYTGYWRYNRPRSEFLSDELGPPPLPPHPQRAIPSVSMAVDSVNAEDNENYANDIM